jgi:hypothetical protein
LRGPHQWWRVRSPLNLGPMGYYRTLASERKNSIDGDAVTGSEYAANRALVKAPNFKAFQAAAELIQSGHSEREPAGPLCLGHKLSRRYARIPLCRMRAARHTEPRRRPVDRRRRLRTARDSYPVHRRARTSRRSVPCLRYTG